MNDEVIIIFWWRYDYDDAQTVPFLGPLSYTASLGKNFFRLFVFCLFMMLNVLFYFCFKSYCNKNNKSFESWEVRRRDME